MESAGEMCDPNTKMCERLFCRKMPNESLYKCSYHIYPLGHRKEGTKFGEFHVTYRDQNLLITPIKDIGITGWMPTKDCIRQVSTAIPSVPSSVSPIPPPRSFTTTPKKFQYTNTLLVGFCKRTLGNIQRTMEVYGPKVMKELDAICFDELEKLVGTKDPAVIKEAETQTRKKMEVRAGEFKKEMENE